MTEDNGLEVSFDGLVVDEANDPLDRAGINIEVLDGGCGDPECACDSRFSATIINLSMNDAAMVVAMVLEELMIQLGDDYDDDED